MCKYEGAVVCGLGTKRANGDELGTRGGFLRAAGRGAPLGTTQQTVIVNKFFFVEQFFVEQFFVVGLGGVGAEFVERGPHRFRHRLGAKGGVSRIHGVEGALADGTARQACRPAQLVTSAWKNFGSAKVKDDAVSATQAQWCKRCLKLLW